LSEKPAGEEGIQITKDLKKYFETLELSENAGYAEVNQAYHKLKKIYSSESNILSPLTRDFSKKKQREILQKLETAHKKLAEYLNTQPRTESEKAEKGTDQEGNEFETNKRLIFSGRNLRGIRTKLGIQPKDMAAKLKIESTQLKALENEKIEDLPEEKELKALLRKYTRILGLNYTVVIRDYLGRIKTKK
jgi:hypothetical protein